MSMINNWLSTYAMKQYGSDGNWLVGGGGSSEWWCGGKEWGASDLWSDICEMMVFMYQCRREISEEAPWVVQQFVPGIK